MEPQTTFIIDGWQSTLISVSWVGCWFMTFSTRKVPFFRNHLLTSGLYSCPPTPRSPCRRPPCRAGEAVRPEVAAVLRPLRLRLRPAERPEMEGGETCGAERDGGAHHPQQERHHRSHLPRGGPRGQYLSRRTPGRLKSYMSDIFSLLMSNYFAHQFPRTDVQQLVALIVQVQQLNDLQQYRSSSVACCSLWLRHPQFTVT